MFRRKLRKLSNAKNVDLQYVSKRTPFWKPLLFLAPAFILIAVFTIIPAITSMSRAIMIPTNPHLASSSTEPGWDNFDLVLKHEDFRHSLLNSLLIASIQLPIAVSISLVISSAIASIIRKRLRGGAQTLFFLPYITSGIAVSLAFAYIFDNKVGLFNQVFNTDYNWLATGDPSSFKPLIIIVVNGVWRALAFQILIFTTAMLGIDKDRFKAASIDGAGPVKQFFQITLPSIRRTLNFIVTVGLIGAIKVFPLALFNNNPDAAMQNGGGTLMLYVYKAIQEGLYGLAAASSIILVIISILFSIVVKNSLRYLGIFLDGMASRRIKRKIARGVK